MEKKKEQNMVGKRLIRTNWNIHKIIVKAMRYSIVFVLLIFISSSCAKTSYYEKKVIKHFSEEGSQTPSSESGTILFVSVDNNKIGKVTFSRLQMIYSLDYSEDYSSFYLFLSDALNQKIFFKEDYILYRNGIVFRIDGNIKKEYEESGVEFLIDNNCEKVEGRLEIKRKYLSEDELYSIMYFLSINNFKITFDDVIGAYYAKSYLLNR
jgi:hypothetical protein